MSAPFARRLILAAAALPSVSALSTNALKAISSPGLITQSESHRFGIENVETNAASDLLQCYQVAPPVLGPSGPVYYPEGSSPEAQQIPSSACQSTLMEYSFAYSYGKPFVGEYS